MSITINLPPKKGTNEQVKLSFEQLVIIGANGAGKTRFGSWIEMNNSERVHRISAQKSLSMPSFVGTTSVDVAKDDLFYGAHDDNREWLMRHGKRYRRWNNNVNTSLLNDFDQLMVLLLSEEFDYTLEYKNAEVEKPTTKLDRIKTIFEKVLPHRVIRIRSGFVEVFPADHLDNKYNGSEMSDGERSVFYLSGEVLCAPPNSIVIIDEPEMHFHSSLIKHFFDLLESERPDCSFVYLTHNIDFAFSRHRAEKIWAKSYDNGIWDYELLDGNAPVPEKLYFEILGSRCPVLFMEGDNSSIDYELYSQVFSEYTLVPVNSCNKVIQITKSFNDARDFHQIVSFGIIDRDRRDIVDVNNLVSRNIWVLDVAEVENLFLLEGVVRTVAKYMGKDPDEVYFNVKNNIIDFFTHEIESQVLLHFRALLKRLFLNLTNFKSTDINSTLIEIDNIYSSINKKDLYTSIRMEFQNLVKKQDYIGILRVFNLKNALIPNSKFCERTGLRNQEELHNLVIALLKKNDALSHQIKETITNSIIRNPICVMSS